MLRKVNFLGHLKEQYGDSLMLNADSWLDVMRLMEANFNNFRKSIYNGKYAIVRGKSLEKDDIIESLDVPELTINFKSDGWEWFIVPELSGAGGKSGGIIQFIAGVILVVAGYVFPAIAAYTVPAGIGLMLGGAATLLTPTYSISDHSNEKPDDKPSILYNGGVNNSEQGGIVPVVLGQVMAGSVLISAGVETFEMTDYVQYDNDIGGFEDAGD